MIKNLALNYKQKKTLLITKKLYHLAKIKTIATLPKKLSGRGESLYALWGEKGKKLTRKGKKYRFPNTFGVITGQSLQVKGRGAKSWVGGGWR